MSNNSLYEITSLLYEILDRVTRIEKALYDDVEESTDLDGGVKFSVVSDEEVEVEDNVIKLPTPE
jgi:hypothetical protein